MSNVSEAEWDLRVDLAAAFHLAVANNLHEEGIANPLRMLRIGLYRSPFCRAETFAGKQLAEFIDGDLHGRAQTQKLFQ